MSLKKYLLDKFPQFLISIIGFIISILILNVFKVELSVKFAITIIFIIVVLLNTLFDFFRRYNFYQNLKNILNKLDQKYLVLEMLNIPDFYDGEIFYNTLYEINKSMIEKVKEYNLSITDFKEYVEMWIHEVKIPISSLILLSHNHKNQIDKRYIEQVRKLDNYIDQILYYVRSENAEKDYLIKKQNLQKIIKSVALKNKDDLLENNVRLEETTDSYIKITALEKESKIYLCILDNGIGIPKDNLSRVFDKSFTGLNGRKKAKSTGMGLYIAKKLCKKLGHIITIESKVGKYTKVTIIFSQNDFYKMN